MNFLSLWTNEGKKLHVGMTLVLCTPEFLHLIQQVQAGVLLAAVIMGFLLGETLRPLTRRQPYVVVLGLCAIGISLHHTLPTSVQQDLADFSVCIGIARTLWPAGSPPEGGRNSRRRRKSVRRWSVAMPVHTG